MIDKSTAIEPRVSLAEYYVEFGKKVPEFVMVHSDAGFYYKTQAFRDAYPDRWYNVGIAEQCSISFAAGLSREGFLPYTCTFAAFLSMRSCEQIRTDLAYGKLRAIIFATSTGYSAGEQGATHSGLEDANIMCGVNGMTVLEVSDPWMVSKMMDAAAKVNGPVYIRASREALPVIYPDNNYKYEIGKAITARKGSDGAFIVSGICVSAALDAAEMIENETGKKIRVIDMHTLKPLDRDAVISAAKTGRVVCAHDHNIMGGLGYHVSSVIAQEGIACKFKILGAPDEFVPLATSSFLYKKNEYDAQGLAKNMKAML
jgi:transketolase